jgi:two-component system, chemotaxis family, protein-glutamate methylesterase/glutaminase
LSLDSRGRCRVLVVDDSAFVRSTVKRLLLEDGAFEVVGAASNGQEAVEAIAALEPDVVTLDLEMPVMDGTTALARLKAAHRRRVLVLSSHASRQSYTTFKALALGATDFVCKPGQGAPGTLQDFGRVLRDKVASVARVSRGLTREKALSMSTESPPPAARPAPVGGPPQYVIGVGGSTGATSALAELLTTLPADLEAAVVVVQHLPPGFADGLCSYLAQRLGRSVRTAVEGEVLERGHVRVAPGPGHLRVQRVGGDYRVRVEGGGPPVEGFRPAIDPLFYSLALAAGGRGRGVVLSGMGNDGANGLAAIRKMGGRTFAQDFASCVVPEMPMRAAGRGAVQCLAPVPTLARALSHSTKGPRDLS